MCLHIDNNSIKQTKDIKKKKAGQTVTRYKVLEWDDRRGVYLSPIMSTRAKALLKSNRKSNMLTLDETNDGRVSYGIHVFTTKSRAKHEFGTCTLSTYKIFEAKCNIDDLVCCGRNDDNFFINSPHEEVYTQIYIPELDKKEKTGEKNMIKWNEIIGDGKTGRKSNTVFLFATNRLTRDEFLKEMSGIPGVRNLVRNRGVNEARNIARKALRRRGVTV